MLTCIPLCVVYLDDSSCFVIIYTDIELQHGCWLAQCYLVCTNILFRTTSCVLICCFVTEAYSLCRRGLAAYQRWLTASMVMSDRAALCHLSVLCVCRWTVLFLAGFPHLWKCLEINLVLQFLEDWKKPRKWPKSWKLVEKSLNILLMFFWN